MFVKKSIFLFFIILVPHATWCMKGFFNPSTAKKTSEQKKPPEKPPLILTRPTASVFDSTRKNPRMIAVVEIPDTHSFHKGEIANTIALDLRGNQYTHLPKLSDYSHLEELDCSLNELTELPATIAFLSKLKHLILRGNKLTSIPSQIGSLKLLTILDVTGNKLKTVPREINFLCQLIWFNVSKNKLSFLPPLNKLSKLTYFNIQENPLPLNDAISLQNQLPHTHIEF